VKVAVVYIALLLFCSSVFAQGQDGDVGEPVAWWRFERIESATAVDSADNGNNGTILGGACRSTDVYAPSQGGRSLKLDGVNDFVLIPHREKLVLTTQGTIELWMKANSDFMLPEGTSLVTKMHNTSAVSYDIRMDSKGKLSGYVNDGRRTDQVVYNLDMRDGIWQHVALTWSTKDKSIKLYVDGILCSESVLQGHGARVSDYDVWIGRAKYAPSSQYFYFKGNIDEVKLYNYARSAAQIEIDAQYNIK